MKNPWTGLVMIRYLRGKGPSKTGSLKRIRGAIFGIALSLVPLLLVYQVADGMIEGITARYMETGTFHIQANYPDGDESGEGIPTYAEAAALLRAIPGITYAGEEAQGMVLAASSSGSLGLSLRGVEPTLKDEKGFSSYMRLVEGDMDFDDPHGLVLGKEAARLLKVKTGDSLRLMSARADTGVFIPKVSRFVVKGIVSSGYQELDKTWCFMNIGRAKSLLPPGGAYHVICIKVREPFALPNPLFNSAAADTDSLFLQIRTALGFSWNLTTWYELQKNQYLSFVATKNLLLFIMFLIVLIASVNVSSAMIMLVMEKQHEIAILKSMGAGPGGIIAIFMGAGAISGAVGAVIGLFLGALLSLGVNELIHAMESAWNAAGALFQYLANPQAAYQSLELFNPAFYLERIPIQLKPGVILTIFVMTLVLSLVASWFPARRAARMRPLEIMRKV